MQSVTQTDCVGSLWWNVVVSKTKHSKTKTEARSTQISKTKHPKLENEAPYLENEAPSIENEDPKISKPSTSLGVLGFLITSKT